MGNTVGETVGRPVDVFLLKLPNHNIDYPSLSIPTLTAALRSAGFGVRQADFNVELRDRLLSATGLAELTYSFLPQVGRLLVGDPPECNRIRRMLDFLVEIDRTVGFDRLERTKQELQARRYEQVLADRQRSVEALTIFVAASLLHNVVDLALTVDELAGSACGPNPVTAFLETKVEEVLATGPRIVGISVLDIQRRASLWFAQRLRPRFAGKIVVGGPDVSIFQEVYVGRYPFLDAAFLKEGEVSLVEYARGAPLAELAGVAFREADGAVRVNPPSHDPARSVFRPDFDGFPLERFLLPTLPVTASRGCSWARCRFCVHHQTYSGHYGRAAREVVDDIEWLSRRHATRLFHFTDDMVDVELGTEIAEELARRRLDVSILAYARFEGGFSAETLETWHRGGFRVIEWGLESASPRLLKAMAKGISIQRVEEVLRQSQAAGIVNKLMMFHNYPGETVEDFERSLAFVESSVRQRLVRPFFTVRNKLELRLNSELERDSRGPRAGDFPKRWERTSHFQAKIEYSDTPDYPEKVTRLEGFLARMQRLVGERRVFSTNDENLTLDLVVADLQRRGAETYFKSI